MTWSLKSTARAASAEAFSDRFRFAEPLQGHASERRSSSEGCRAAIRERGSSFGLPSSNKNGFADHHPLESLATPPGESSRYPAPRPPGRDHTAVLPRIHWTYYVSAGKIVVIAKSLSKCTLADLAPYSNSDPMPNFALNLPPSESGELVDIGHMPDIRRCVTRARNAVW